MTYFFVNTSEQRRDARFTMPLLAGAACAAFEAALGDSCVLRGEVRPRANARAEFNRARAHGQTAALLEVSAVSCAPNLSERTSLNLSILASQWRLV